MAHVIIIIFLLLYDVHLSLEIKILRDLIDHSQLILRLNTNEDEE